MAAGGGIAVDAAAWGEGTVLPWSGGGPGVSGGRNRDASPAAPVRPVQVWRPPVRQGDSRPADGEVSDGLRPAATAFTGEYRHAQFPGRRPGPGLSHRNLAD